MGGSAMDRVIAILSHPFTLLIRRNVWERSAAVLALALLVILLLWKALVKLVRAAAGIAVKGFYFLFCEFAFHLTRKNADWTKVQNRNALAAKCEQLYDKTRSVKKARRGWKIIAVLLLYAVALGLIALPYGLGSNMPEEIIPVVSAVTNLYHKAEAPILRQAMRTSPLIPTSISRLNDVEPQNPYREGIQFACSRGLMEYNGGYFFPDGILTREELAVMLYRYSGEPAIGSPAMIADMQPDMRAGRAVCWCVEQEILTLGTDGSFSGGNQITYEQFLAALARFADTEGLETKSNFNISALSGREDIHSWAMDACQWAAEADILILDRDGHFPAREPLSREKAAGLFFRFSMWESRLNDPEK